MKKQLITFCIAFISLATYAQTECTQYHRKNCGDREGVMMKYDSQSKSAILGKGQVSEFHMVAYPDLDYRITVCAEEILGQMQFRIYQKTRVLVKEEEGESNSEETESDEEEDYDDYSEEETTVAKKEPEHKIIKELLYDNADDGYKNFIEFTAEGSMSLIIEVVVPGSDNKSKLKIRETGCVGVLIEHNKAKKVGF